jgi:hypothetical protein
MALIPLRMILLTQQTKRLGHELVRQNGGVVPTLLFRAE